MATKFTVRVDMVALAATRLAGMVTKSPATVVLRDPPAALSIEGDEIRAANRVALPSTGQFLRPDLVVVPTEHRSGLTDRGVELPPMLVVADQPPPNPSGWTSPGSSSRSKQSRAVRPGPEHVAGRMPPVS